MMLKFLIIKINIDSASLMLHQFFRIHVSITSERVYSVVKYQYIRGYYDLRKFH